MNIYIGDFPFSRDIFKDVSLDKIFDYYKSIEDSSTRADRYNQINEEICCILKEIVSLKERIIDLEKEQFKLFGNNSSYCSSK